MFNSCLLQLSLEQNLKQLRKTLIYTSQCKTHTFRATINLLFFSLARYTRPNFPEPSGFPMSKSWSCHLFSFLVLETFVSPNHLCASLPFPPPSPHTYHLFYCLVWQLKIEWLLQLQEQKLWKKRWMVLWRWKKVGRLLACACLWETTCDKNEKNVMQNSILWTYFVWSPLASVGSVPAAYLAAIAARGRVDVVGFAILDSVVLVVALTGLRTLWGAWALAFVRAA